VDGTFLFLVVGLAIAAIALVFLVKINPIFLPFFIIGLIFIIFLSGILSNIYQEMSEDNNLSTEANQLTVIDTVLTYMPIMIAVFGILLMILSYKTWNSDQG
jgi:hypothetical protein